MHRPETSELAGAMTPLAIARLAGLLYLAVAILAGFAQFYRLNTIVPGDATTTVNNIFGSLFQFRMSFVCDLVGQVAHVFLILLLYNLLKKVDGGQAVVMAVLALIPVPMALSSQFNQLAAVLLVDGGSSLKAFSSDQTNTQILFFLNLQKHGILVAQVFWGLWLFPFGYLIVRSTFLPRLLAVLLWLAGLIYIVGSTMEFLFPGFGVTFQPAYIIPSVAEIVTCLWLLIRGINVVKYEARYSDLGTGPKLTVPPGN